MTLRACAAMLERLPLESLLELNQLTVDTRSNEDYLVIASAFARRCFPRLVVRPSEKDAARGAEA